MATSFCPAGFIQGINCGDDGSGVRIELRKLYPSVDYCG